ncbi:MAG: hypothetical protein EAX91_14620 [Candidatus Lokiarchaeota archaeon]|nr:hypothetical protein [Candidatus Lokiarchaeota archaeon]
MEKKYLPLIVGFIVSIILFATIYILHIISISTGLSLIPEEYISIFIPLLPGPMITDVILLYAFPLVIYFLLNFISPYIVQFIYKVNRISYVFRKAPNYGFLSMGKNIKPSRIFFRAFLVSLFAFGTSAVLFQLGAGNFFRATLEGGGYIPSGLYAAEAIFFGTFFISSLSMLVFLPSWYLEDSGLVSYRHFPEQRRTPIIEGVHRWYINIVGAYTGISTIFTLFQVITKAFPDAEFGPALLTPIIVIISPLILTGLLALPMYLYEKNMEKMQNRIHRRLAKYNLRHFTMPEYADLKDIRQE